MNFLHPGIALAAVGAVALPIIIHLLFRRRRIPVDWAAMELLREAVKRTSRRLKFEQWLVLALRALAVLCVGLGLAVPFLGKDSVLGDRARTLMLVVDDGTTSALRIGAETELGRVRAEASKLIAERGTRDRVGIVLASTPPRLLLAPTGDAAQIDRELAAITPSESPSDLRGAVDLARGSLAAEAASSSGAVDGQIVIASAFRAGSLGVAAAVAAEPTLASDAEPPDEARSKLEIVALPPARDAPIDVHVVEIEARPSPVGGTVAVRVDLLRQGASLDAGRSEVRVTGDGFAPAQPRLVNWERGQSEATVEFQVVPQAAGATGSRRAAIEVRLDDDALTPGNAAWTVVDVRDEVEVGVIGRRGALDASDLDQIPASLWVSRALSPAVGSGMRLRDIDPAACDARALLGLDAVVIARPDLLSQSSADAIGAFVRGGGVAVVLPAGESRVQSWGSMLLPRLGVTLQVGAEAVDSAPPRLLAEEQPTSRILASIEPELAALVAPVSVSRSVAIEGAAAGEVVLAFADGTPFVVAQTTAANEGASEASGGLVVLFASAPELAWSNLPVKPLMVPLFQETVRTALQMAAVRDEVAVGSRVRGKPGTRLRAGDGSVVVVEQDGASVEPIRAAGVLRGDGGSVLVVNQPASSLALTPLGDDAVRAAFRGNGTVRIAAIAGSNEAVAAEAALAKEARSGANQGARIAFALLVLALAALLFEGFLSRFFSHASLERAGRSGGIVATVGRVRPRGGALAKPAGDERVPVGGGR
ncbi:MAG: hypothetical protein RLY21_1589 [Planctomycetota bacterium]|jgi:hypothetical protein